MVGYISRFVNCLQRMKCLTYSRYSETYLHLVILENNNRFISKDSGKLPCAFNRYKTIMTIRMVACFSM